MIRHYLYTLISMFLLQLSHKGSAQVINIESARMQSDTTGWMGSANAAFGITQSVDHIVHVGLGAHIQYKTQKDYWLLLGNYEFLKGADKKFADNSLGHLRYNRKINKWLRWEIFFQAQNNLVTQLRARILIGTGPRFKIYSTKFFHLYAASLVMYEREKENTNPFIIHNDIRSSSYISFTILPGKNIEFISTTYYQPLFNKISDFRVLNQASLKVKADKHFSLSLVWNYLHDSYPPGISPETTYSFAGAIGYEF